MKEDLNCKVMCQFVLIMFWMPSGTEKLGTEAVLSSTEQPKMVLFAFCGPAITKKVSKKCQKTIKKLSKTKKYQKTVKSVSKRYQKSIKSKKAQKTL